MGDETRNALHRALDDLAGGVRALLGLGRSEAKLVEELLKNRDGGRRGQRKAARGRTGGPSKNPLVRVK